MSSDTDISVPAQGLSGCHHSSLKGFSSMSLETNDFLQLSHERREEGGSLEMLMTLFDEVRKRYHAEQQLQKIIPTEKEWRVAGHYSNMDQVY